MESIKNEKLKKYIHFENLSVVSGLGVTILDTSGQTLFLSSIGEKNTNFIEMLHSKLDCEERSRTSFLYGCYQARRFGGRYVFFAPSGLTYCAAPLLDHKGKMVSGVIIGPFLMVEHEDFLNYDIKEYFDLSVDDLNAVSEGIYSLEYISPKRAHSLNEHLYYIATTFFSNIEIAESVPPQIEMFSSEYPIEKEGELLTAISNGDIHSADEILGDIIKQIIQHHGGNLEIVRSRVVELTVLLSRASLKGGANVNSILGLNYDYLREIDSCSSIADIILWLQAVTRRFTRQVFEFSESKHVDIIYKAVEYIKRNYSSKMTLKEISDYLFISQPYFCRIFKEETGQTPGGYITFVRIEESKKILLDSNINIVDIPELVGFEGQSYFTKIFKKVTGYTPAKYRRENLKR